MLLFKCYRHTIHTYIHLYIYVYITYNAIIIQCYNHVMYVIVESSPLLVIVPLRVFILRMVLTRAGINPTFKLG